MLVLYTTRSVAAAVTVRSTLPWMAREVDQNNVGCSCSVNPTWSGASTSRCVPPTAGRPRVAPLMRASGEPRIGGTYVGSPAGRGAVTCCELAGALAGEDCASATPGTASP